MEVQMETIKDVTKLLSRAFKKVISVASMLTGGGASSLQITLPSLSFALCQMPSTIPSAMAQQSKMFCPRTQSSQISLKQDQDVDFESLQNCFLNLCPILGRQSRRTASYTANQGRTSGKERIFTITNVYNVRDCIFKVNFNPFLWSRIPALGSDWLHLTLMFEITFYLERFDFFTSVLCFLIELKQ